MADEQVGNNSYLTMTPGSAVAGQLQNILAQKRLDAHQALMDSIAQQNAGLNERNINSQIQDRDKQAATNEEYRQGLIANRKTQELQRLTSILPPGTPFNNTEGADYKLLQENAPSLIDPGQTPTDPLGPGEEGPSRPALPPSYHGTGPQLETQRKTSAQLKAAEIVQSPEFANMDTAQKAYWYEQATLHQSSAGVINPKSDDYVPYLTSQQAEDQGYVPANAKIAPREPRIPPSALDIPKVETFQLPDPTDPTKTVQESHWLKPGEQPSAKSKISGLLVRTPPGGPVKPAKEPSQQIRTAFGAAKQAWLQHPKDATRETMLKHWAGQFINEYQGVDPTVKEKVLSLYNQPGYRNMSLNDFKDLVDTKKSDPKNAQDATMLWQQLVQ